MTLHEYQVIGRLSPTAKNPNPKVYRMRIFAPNPVVARSRYWYFISRLVKAKKGTGEILTVNRLFEQTPHKVKNFGLLLRYNSRSGTHNLYKEFRDVTREGAVNQLYADMAARHRARFPSIHLIDVKEVAAAQCRRALTKQFHSSTIKFPLPHRVVRPASKKYTKTFAPSRPHTFF